MPARGSARTSWRISIAAAGSSPSTPTTCGSSLIRDGKGIWSDLDCVFQRPLETPAGAADVPLRLAEREPPQQRDPVGSPGVRARHPLLGRDLDGADPSALGDRTHPGQAPPRTADRQAHPVPPGAPGDRPARPHLLRAQAPPGGPCPGAGGVLSPRRRRCPPPDRGGRPGGPRAHRARDGLGACLARQALVDRPGRVPRRPPPGSASRPGASASDRPDTRSLEMSMRRVLFICATPVAFGLDTPPEIGLGGIESTNIALSRALARRGWAVTLATRRSGTVERDGVRNIPLGEAAGCEADAVVTSNDPRPLRAHPGRRGIVWVHNPLNVEKSVRKGYLLPFLSLRPEAVFVGTLAARIMSPLYPFRRRHVDPARRLARLPDARADAGPEPGLRLRLPAPARPGSDAAALARAPHPDRLGREAPRLRIRTARLARRCADRWCSILAVGPPPWRRSTALRGPWSAPAPPTRPSASRRQRPRPWGCRW